MLIGDKKGFAVELDVEDVFNGWVFGTYRFWVHGVSVGDEADHSVDLKGCWNWMRDVIAHPMERYEPGLYEMDKGQVYLRLASSVLPNQNPGGFSKELYEDIYSRFHISHIGMSSFDRVTVLLLKNRDGLERLVWRDWTGDIQDAHLGKDQLETVFAEAVASLEGTMSAAGDKR